MELVGAARRLPGLRRCALGRLQWICASCRHAARAPRRFQSSTAKPYYVTTPIFYVNASPHVGHMYSMVLADALKRWQALRGRRALLCTGTDEHGMKVQRAAALEDMPPKQFCDTNAATFSDLARKAHIDNDFFIRTTDADHVEAVNHFWLMLRERGHIYESKHSGWYSVSDEAFYPESMIEKKIAPMTGKVHMASVETGNMVEWIEEKNYHFRLTDMKDQLLAFYRKNPQWVLPAAKMDEVVHWVQHNLQDLSISRPLSRLEWGIPVPDDPSQTIYVWVDALVNYITKAGFPNWAPGSEHDGGWPADVQVIGKDILRFHAVYWPALLLALDMPPPKRILSHAHWTLDRKKMSKSTGNAVNPFFAIDRFGVDVMRFYLLHDGGIERDSDYHNAHIVGRYNKALRNGLGNLLGRVTLPKQWSVQDAVETARDGKLAPVAGHACVDQANILTGLPTEVSERMDQLDSSAALQAITAVIFETNRYLERTAPWNLAKAGDDASLATLRQVVYYAAESLRIVGILLQPFMPTKAAELLDALGVSEENRAFEHARLGADFEYGEPKTKVRALFPPLAVEG